MLRTVTLSLSWIFDLQVYQYELSSRLLHGSFSVEFGELNSLSMQKVHFFDKTGLLITKRCGNIQERFFELLMNLFHTNHQFQT